MTFSFGLYCYGDEVETLRECLAGLRAAYPGAAVVLLHDGPIERAELRPVYIQIAEQHGAMFEETPARLRRHPYGGLWIRYLLTAALRAAPDAEWVVKLDPDTRTIRAVSSMPDFDVCGYLRLRADASGKTDYFCTAAWVALRRKLAARLAFSLSPLGGERFQGKRYRGVDGLAIGSWILHDAAKGLGATVGRHPEVYLQWREDVPRELWQKYAVVNVETRAVQTSKGGMRHGKS